MRKKSIVSVTAIVFLFLTVIAFSSEKKEVTRDTKMPDNVKAVIDKSCFGCHNTQSKNEDAKEELDFKKMDGLSDMKKIGAYKNIAEVVEEGDMPPKKFLEKYPDKKLTAEEKEILVKWAKKEAEDLVKSKQ